MNPNLRYFSLNYAQDMKGQLLNSLPILNYRTLLIPILFSDLTFIQAATLLTNLTVDSSTSWSIENIKRSTKIIIDKNRCKCFGIIQ